MPPLVSELNIWSQEPVRLCISRIFTLVMSKAKAGKRESAIFMLDFSPCQTAIGASYLTESVSKCRNHRSAMLAGSTLFSQEAWD
jgi:hypothetical protein